LHQAEVRVADETESERHRRNSESVGVETERLDELVLAIYGWRFKEFVDELFWYAYHKGLEAGERKGFVAGRRAAKGLTRDAKKRGRPPTIEQGVRTLHAWYVEQEKQNGKTVRQSTREFLDKMRIGQNKSKSLAKRSPAEPLALPSDQQAMQAYYRDRRKKRGNSLSK
jgi:hypothetical protein